jgi:hypothetical protein
MIEDDEIKTARAFLCRCHRSSREAMSSTVLKGIIERWSGRYVGNADVTDAARSLGFAVAPCRAPSNVPAVLRPAPIRPRMLWFYTCDSRCSK